ncbi:uncharacterized protein HMPREF1541_06455 [Cyphellophora europaea CBS 101466]|uniref:Heterokaryon incompatibility domain-containing protein n=1 Tax=Cyphellophora europaea (strain CBS 101466) TaxID=1220924 RepID=W2RQ53_CYPE1|nr:uncharacterized protein HMPREF1541_06455 [Cyphellophora europaea CBS 101466]ETN38420.1 hypothetical protein HMPREF1541_06455 [Cyphellophora europaea CBS 101466]
MDDRILRFIQENPSHTLYRHRPLETVHSFRLIEILPGTADAEVAVKVDNHCLNNAPPYSALSYTWGEETGIVYISCNGSDLPVTETLANVLRLFRSSDRSEVFWIDQCCIDQSNTQERSRQVNLMYSIYSSAQTIEAWLGADSSKLGPTLRTLLMQIDCAIDSIATIGVEHLAAGSKISVTAEEDSIPGTKPIYDLTKAIPTFSGEEFLKCHGLPLADSSDWKSLWECLTSRYFSRVWTIQELHAAGVARLRWGQSELEWPLLYNAIRFCETYFVHPDLVAKPPNEWHILVAPFIKEKEGPRSTLLRYLLDSTVHKCADKRDKIFGLVGVCSTIGVSNEHFIQDTHKVDASERLQADYNLTWQEVMRDTCRAICYASTTLEILCYVSHNSLPPTNGLPSWSLSPDRENSIPEVDAGFFSSNLVACGQSLPRLGNLLDDGPEILRARGIRVDRVLAVTEPIPLGYQESMQIYLPSAERFEDAWMLMKSSLINPEQDPEDLDPVAVLASRVPDFIETICCSSRERMTSDDIREETVYLYAAYQLESALARVRDYCRQPTDSPLSNELFFPESGVFAATCAVYLDAVSHDPDVIRDTMGTHVAAEVDQCRKLVDNIFATSAADEKSAMLQSLVFGLCVVRQKNVDWRQFGDKCWDGKERSFFTTEGGRIGRGAKLLQPGDDIHVLYGGPAPFVSRSREDDARWLIGACYLHGMMEGEAIDEMSDLGLVEEDLVLA